MLRFEFEEPRRSSCQCCGKETTSLTRFVYKDDDAFGVYYAQFTDGHAEKRLSGIIGLGEWEMMNLVQKQDWRSLFRFC